MEISRWAVSDDPLAYLITFTCYGTFLHGDLRMAVDRRTNKFGTPFLQPNLFRFRGSQRRMKYPAYRLGKKHRVVVNQSIQETCHHRSWRLRASHVRSNHVHAVISASGPPEPVRQALKSYASRDLNRAGIEPLVQKRWTRHGSNLYLWNEESVQAAVRYVIDLQGTPMEFFEEPSEP